MCDTATFLLGSLPWRPERVTLAQVLARLG